MLLAPGSATAAQPSADAAWSARALTAQGSAPTPLLPTDVPTDLDPLAPQSPGAAQPEPSRSAAATPPGSATAEPSSPGTPAPATAGQGAADDGHRGLLLLLPLLAWLLASAGALRRMLYAWWSPSTLETTGFSPGPDAEPELRVSVLVAARHEGPVLAETLDRLAASDHRDLQVLAVVSDDDLATMRVATASAARYRGRVQVVVDRTVPPSKHAALGVGLAQATGQVVAIIDAEDDVHPQLVSAAVAHLAATGVGVLQTGVQQVTPQRGWWALRACLGDHFLFRSELHALAARGVLPVAGTGVFIRRSLLHEVLGWDPSTLADADLAIRLQARGVLADVAYDPSLATREETPEGVRAFVGQRTRRDQGALQLLRHRPWRHLTTRSQRWLALRTFARPYVDAVLAPVPLVLLVLGLLHVATTGVAVLAPVVLALIVMRLLIESAGLREMGRDHGLEVRARDHVVLVLSAAPYRLLLMAAAASALCREVTGRRSWLPTAHPGSHRPPDRRPVSGSDDGLEDHGHEHALQAGRLHASPPQTIDLRHPQPRPARAVASQTGDIADPRHISEPRDVGDPVTSETQ